MQIRRMDTEGLLHLLYCSYLDFNNSVLFFPRHLKACYHKCLATCLIVNAEEQSVDTVRSTGESFVLEVMIHYLIMQVVFMGNERY